MYYCPLLQTDVYKLGHQLQYQPGTDFVYSYLNARSTRYYQRMVFFGLQYFLKEYLQSPIILNDVYKYLDYKEEIVGSVDPQEEENMRLLEEVGYWPVEIRAVPEGTVLETPNCLFTVHSTDPRFYWCVGFIESLLLKVWYPTTVATASMHYREVVDRYCNWTGEGPRDFMVHDFGYRSDSSEEGAAISGAAHLISFNGSDTIPALPFIDEYYAGRSEGTMLSVPATEHSVMCSYGPDNEMAAFERMLDIYPSGIVSIVSDTYDIWRVCTDYLPKLKERILSREGKVVIRPDSGHPPSIICGDPDAAPGTPEHKGVLRLLHEEFGGSTNDKGYIELNPKIGLIYGDGMYLQRYEETLDLMKMMNFAANNLIIGCRGILRSGTRDTLGMALKATHVRVNGSPLDILKTPITDPGKKSHTGFIRVVKDGPSGRYITLDHQKEEDCCTGGDILQPVFRNGEILKDFSFEEVRENYRRTK